MHPTAHERLLADLKAALASARVDTSTGPQAADMLELALDYARAGGDLAQLCPERVYLTPLWLAVLLGMETRANGQDMDSHGVVQQGLQLLKPHCTMDFARARNGRGLYSTCIREGGFATARVLLENGLNIHVEKRAPLLFTLECFTPHQSSASELALLEHLLQQGLSPNCSDDGNRIRPLAVACEKSLVEAAAMLLHHGAEVNAQNRHGATALLHAIDTVITSAWHACARTRRAELVELLLAHGARLDMRTTQNRTFYGMVKKVCGPEEQAQILDLIEKHRTAPSGRVSRQDRALALALPPAFIAQPAGAATGPRTAPV